jgi:hypothetical protein
MTNPFYLQEVPVDAPFCNRLKELRELQSYAEARANVVLYSPRRFGKTSLVRKVQNSLEEKGAITVFADFFGVTSVEDVAARLAKAVFAVTHKRESFWKQALKTISSFRPVLKPDPEGGISLSVEPASAGRGGIELLEETLESIGAFVQGTRALVNVALDEFQEIVVLKEALRIEAAMRSRMQRQGCSYFFVGSRRRVLLGIFNERQRPFFQSAINYPLPALPREELVDFLIAQFAAGGKPCGQDLACSIADKLGCHPYYSQKMAFLSFENCDILTEEAVSMGYKKLLASEQPVFEAIVQGLSPHQRLLLRALALEPTGKPLSSAYIHKHGLGSVGGVQHSLKRLDELDLIEKSNLWRVVDPLFAGWIKGQVAETI